MAVSDQITKILTNFKPSGMDIAQSLVQSMGNRFVNGQVANPTFGEALNAARARKIAETNAAIDQFSKLESNTLAKRQQNMAEQELNWKMGRPGEEYQTLSGAELNKQYGIEGDPNKLYRMNTATGKVEQIGQSGVTINMGGEPPKAPPSWENVQNPDGTWTQRPVAGGKADREIKDAEEAAKMKTAETKQYADIVTQDIDRIIDIAMNNTIPVTGGFSALSAIPGTAAHNVAKILDAVKANIGFKRLQEMRDASPTGGALGQVSERENTLLQSAYGSLSQSLTQDEFVRNLKRVRDLYSKIINEGIGPDEATKIKQGMKAEGAPRRSGVPTESMSSTGGPEVGAIEQGYRFKGGDPANQDSWEKIE